MVDILCITGLRLGYGRGPDVIRGIDLTIKPGETVAILGPSGGGKSTLVKAIAGLLAPRAGSLEVAGRTWPQRPAAGAVGYVPQRLGLVRHASALDNALLGGLHMTSMWQSVRRRPPVDVEVRAKAALAQLGLADKMDVAIHQLSGGEQRRTTIARALVQRPRLLLADEFLGESDAVTMETVVKAVRALQVESGMALLIIEHHLDRAWRVADRVFHLEDGALVPAMDPKRSRSEAGDGAPHEDP